MTFSKIGRMVSALVASAALGLGMTACGGGTIAYMWVLGSANSSTGTSIGQISGFKIDDFTGNLTASDHSPYSSNGSNPQMIVVKPGGRFVYVVNSGIGEVGTPNTSGYKAPTGSGITEYSVGSGGLLTYQATFSSQGYHPIYLQFDSTGNFLYVTDLYSPNYCAQVPCTTPGGAVLNNADLNGSITAFSVASDTGRLTLIQNTTILNPNQTPTNVFEVGPGPVMSKTGSSCLYTISANAVFPYQISSANGQLTVPTTGPQLITGATGLTSINTGSSSYVYFTDGPTNQVLAYQAAGTACTLSPIPASQSTNLITGVIPVYSVSVTNGSNSFLYVLNQSIPSTQPGGTSSISAFTVNTNGALQTLGAASGQPDTSNPYPTGSGPVCMVEDPTNKFLYNTNHNDSTVTGKQITNNRGFLSDLNHGSTFPTVQNPTCLAISGNV
jgi:6-phosphogluconolactonase (cycloisomerase 2 family)